jgi:polysaccharide pyruvyl transferase CsaB
MAAMGTEVKRIAISGYYGFGNSGDEAVLLSILLALEEEGARQGVRVEPVVLSADPESTARMYGVRAVHRMRFSDVWGAIRECDGLISGGGSLLQDVTSFKTIPYYLAVIRLAQLFRKPAFIYAQGIGPVRRPVFHRFIRTIFNKCQYISVRDEESAALLAEMGIESGRAEIVPDPVMGLPFNKQTELASDRSDCVIGVSVRFWNEDRSELDALAEALAMIAESRSVRFRFLPFHGEADTSASRYVIERMEKKDRLGARIELAEYTPHPQDMLANVSACGLLIGMRLHSLIYAASQLVPFVGISYDPKIDQFLRRLGMEASSSVSNMQPIRIAQDALRLLEHEESWRMETKDAVARLKQEAVQPAKQIISYLAR